MWWWDEVELLIFKLMFLYIWLYLHMLINRSINKTLLPVKVSLEAQTKPSFRKMDRTFHILLPAI